MHINLIMLAYDIHFKQQEQKRRWHLYKNV